MPELWFGDRHALARWAIPHLRPAINAIADLEPFSAIGIVNDGNLAGAVFYNNYLGHDVHMTIAAPGGRWANRQVLQGLFEYPFKQLGCARVSATTATHNCKAIKLLVQAGFTAEGIIRRGILGTTDAMLFGMLKQECKWING